MNEIKTLVYNIAQLFFILSLQKIKILEWGRGTGKSTILGKDIIDHVVQLPRSSGVLVASTYQQILTRTLPSTIAGMETHGIYKDLHYIVGKRPPKSWNWPEPYEPPLDYRRCIIFWNGTVLNFVSQDSSSGSGRGMNTDWIVGDEAALLNEKKFQTDVILTNRGNAKRIAHYPDGSWKNFEDCPLHHSITLASSTPITSAGMWFLKYEEQAVLEPDKVLFLRASAVVNKHNLGEDYFKNAKAIMPDFLYKAEVENVRLKRIEDGFYPLLDDKKHCYNNFDYSHYSESTIVPTSLGDADVDPNKPLILGMDWGKNINCLVVAQNSSDVEMRILNNFYVMYPKIIDDLISEEFAPYYKYHKKKLVYLWYDPTGNINQANSKRTYAEQAKEKFEEYGWQVILMTKGVHNVLHETKYYLMMEILKEKNTKYPKIKFNKSNCKELWISMSNAPAKVGRNESIKKDKSSESKKGMDQSHATHLSDAFDVIMVGMFLNRMSAPTTFIETRTY